MDDTVGAPGAPGAGESWTGAAGVRFVVAPDEAQHELQFVAPVSETGVAAEWLRVHGPSPCEVTLRGPAAVPSLLDAARTQNARILL